MKRKEEEKQNKSAHTHTHVHKRYYEQEQNEMMIRLFDGLYMAIVLQSMQLLSELNK
jgi:hypothetical protein